MNLRIAEPRDIDNIREVINAAFKKAEAFFVEGDRIRADEVRALMGTGTLLLAEDEKGLAGCVYVESRGERAYLGLLSVYPGRQRAGIGSRLMAAAEDMARKAGCRFMDIRVVDLRTELPDYYSKLGYSESGVAPFPSEVPTKLPCHFILMTKPI